MSDLMAIWSTTRSEIEGTLLRIPSGFSSAQEQKIIAKIEELRRLILGPNVGMRPITQTRPQPRAPIKKPTAPLGAVSVSKAKQPKSPTKSPKKPPPASKANQL